jgi:hypothetical protein
MRRLKLFLPALILAGGFVVPVTVSFGKVEYTKPGGIAAGVKCTVCHSKGKELNEVGKCFKEKKDLKACQTQ